MTDMVSNIGQWLRDALHPESQGALNRIKMVIRALV
jgi:hypothetical protein